MQSLLTFTTKASPFVRTSRPHSVGIRFAIAAILLPTAALAEPPSSAKSNQLPVTLASLNGEAESSPAEILPQLEPWSESPDLAVELLQPSWSFDEAIEHMSVQSVQPQTQSPDSEQLAKDLAQDADPTFFQGTMPVERGITAPGRALAEGTPQSQTTPPTSTENLISLDETLRSEAMLLASPSPLLANDAFNPAEEPESESSSEDAATPESLTSNFFIKPQVDFSRTILDWQETVTGKPKAILEMGEAGIIPETGIVLSGAYWASQMYEYSNTAGKFPILSRFPSQHNNRSKSGQEFIINNAALGITGRLADWGTVYLQPEYTEIEFPGQEEWQWRKAFVMVGNLDKFPLYAYYGRNTVDFGWMDGYNPFTHSVNNHFYRVDSDEAVLGLGYAQGGLHVIGTAIPSGRQLRVADTSNSDGWDNFSVNASYDIPLGQAADLTLGGGYLHSTIYNRVIAHHPGPTFAQALANGDEPKRNGAYDLFAELQWEDLRAGVEYTSSLKKWPATDAKVQALTVQGAYDLDIGDVPLTLSAVYGLGLQGPDDEEYERLSQLAIGLEADIADYVTFAFEYVRNDGFVPLVAITRASDRDVTTNTYIFGMKLRF